MAVDKDPSIDFIYSKTLYVNESNQVFRKQSCSNQFYSFLDLFHIYDRLVDIFHAGALISITSFGHSLMHGAMAATQEYGIFGIAMGMFDLTAAGISAAILFAFLAAMIFKPKS